LNSLYAWLRRRRLEFDFIYLCQGSIRACPKDPINPGLSPLTVTFLQPEDMRFIGAHFERDFSEAHFLKMLTQGFQCLGLKHRGEIVSYCWFNLQECESKYLSFRLPEGDAYLMGVRTYSSYRGKNLAVYLQQQLQSHLAQIGCRNIWAIIHYGNLASLRAHCKAGILPVRLYLYLELFKKHSWRLHLRSYRRRS
jgi:hypothetical protein